jgi:hypothetical protein
METYITRKNIERYQKLLESETLDETKRMIITKLLAQEEMKLEQLEKGSGSDD